MPIFFPSSLQGVPKISQNPPFKFSHFGMPPPRDTAEKRKILQTSVLSGMQQYQKSTENCAPLKCRQNCHRPLLLKFDYLCCRDINSCPKNSYRAHLMCTVQPHSYKGSVETASPVDGNRSAKLTSRARQKPDPSVCFPPVSPNFLC